MNGGDEETDIQLVNMRILYNNGSRVNHYTHRYDLLTPSSDHEQDQGRSSVNSRTALVNSTHRIEGDSRTTSAASNIRLRSDSDSESSSTENDHLLDESPALGAVVGGPQLGGLASSTPTAHIITAEPSSSAGNPRRRRRSSKTSKSSRRSGPCLRLKKLLWPFYCILCGFCIVSRRCCSTMGQLLFRAKQLKPRDVLIGAESNTNFDPKVAAAQKYPPNVIRNQKYNIITFLPVVLFNQFKFFLNLFFLLMACSQFIPQFKVCILPANGSKCIAPLPIHDHKLRSYLLLAVPT